MWYHNGEEIVPDYSREILKDGSLTMPSIVVRHTGTYKVVAEHEAGKKEGEVKLYVEDEEGLTKPKQGKGKPPLKSRLKVKSNNYSNTYKFKCIEYD